MPFGPQAGSGFMSPTPQQPMGMDPMADWTMQNDARQQALMHGMRGMLNNQYQGNLQGAGMMGARVANQGLGNPIGQALAPVGQAVRSGASALKGLAGFGAQQSYNVGGPTTLGATSASSAGLTAGQGLSTGAGPGTYPAAGGSLAGDTAGAGGSGAGSLLGPALTYAGAAYAGYSGITGAQARTDRLHEAISYGMSDEDAAALKQKTFNAGVHDSGIGALTGAAGGFLGAGPVGAVVGGIGGGIGGAAQAWQSADSGSERWEMQKEFQKNPFKR
jgi:hypothetical protein